MKLYHNRLPEKLNEALKAVLPIIAIVLILTFTIAPVPPSILLSFILGAFLIIIGMMFFTLGAELSMSPMGEKVGTHMTKSGKLFFVLLLCFVLGFIVTVSEPDLQVLAEQVPAIPNHILILSVAVGVGFFLLISMLRMLLAIPLAHMLIFFYAIIFIMAFFIPKDFLAVAFDSGAIAGKAMGTSLSIGVAISVGLAMIRVLTGISILYFIIPGYLLAIVLSFFVPRIFTAIAFDSGGVAMVAMTPLITIQCLGCVYRWKSRRQELAEEPFVSYLDSIADDEIIEL